MQQIKLMEYAWADVTGLLANLGIPEDPVIEKTHECPPVLANAITERVGDLSGKVVACFGASKLLCRQLLDKKPKGLAVVDEDLRALAMARMAFTPSEQVSYFLGSAEEGGIVDTADVVVAWRLGRYLDDCSVLGTVREALRVGGTGVVACMDSGGTQLLRWAQKGYRAMSYGYPARISEMYQAYPAEWVEKTAKNVLLDVKASDRVAEPDGTRTWRVLTVSRPGFEESVEMIPGWFSVPEAKLMRDRVASLPDPASVVQLGVWAGKSLYAACEGLKGKGGSVHAVDLWSERAEAVKTDGLTATEALRWLSRMVSSTRLNDFVYVVMCDSSKAANLHHKGQVDLLFIDAGHFPPEVRADVDAWLPKMRPGSLVLFHDCYLPGVRAAIESAAGHLEFVERVESLEVYKVR